MNREQIMTAYSRKLEQIENSRTYSDHAKRVMAAKAYTAAQDAMNQLREAEVQQLTSRRSDLRRRMFGHPDTSDAQTLMARRNATEMAGQLDNPRIAAEELNKALQQGDSIMARAIAQRASDWNWGDVLTTYADTRTDFRRLVDEYNSTPDPADQNWRLGHNFAHVVPTPDVLGGMPHHQVASLATQELEDVA
ncbi:hypothetical protein ACH4F6_08830 [Streptomyces sp. NPDC017936]|uniref:hypothetical protein n=1 Tax=Streptomyces sp. NPDC017936 TaxID=3365016 RepID=UPI00378CC586